ncbi:hypothetical protein [Rhodanobacter glycinis]|uniref:hypothetical protein n=1 Tax=Rhodanobacter glycinis TaxID=582702 RepID=UPI0013763A7F|nr:hypothetical protein [Rhodanobacter glycinis]
MRAPPAACAMHKRCSGLAPEFVEERVIDLVDRLRLDADAGIPKKLDQTFAIEMSMPSGPPG